MIDSLTTLPDGRTLAYAGYGVTDGPLVMYFHGTPSSRLDLVALDDAFVGLGVRVVAPDRPGMGGSTACASRSLSGWADDVASLADHLGAYQFAVMGLSGGGPYAVACAAFCRAGCSAQEWSPV